MNWPDSLVAEIAERRCIVFLGAGASASSVDPATGSRPPSWKQLLEDALALVADPAITPLVNDLIVKEQYLDAAEIIFSRFEPSDSRTFFRSRLYTPRYEKSEIHQIVLELDPKILITTNYDEIYDSFCTCGDARDGYSIRKYYDDNVLDEIRSTARLVLKAHGCITDTTKMVLTRSEYFHARARHAGFFSILDSLFLVNTLLFIGYSLSDPDITLVLETAQLSAPSRHPHYALVPAGKHSAIVKAIKDTYNVRLLEYENEAGDHSSGLVALRELRDLVNSYRSTYS